MNGTCDLSLRLEGSAGAPVKTTVLVISKLTNGYVTV